MRRYRKAFDGELAEPRPTAGSHQIYPHESLVDRSSVSRRSTESSKKALKVKLSKVRHVITNNQKSIKVPHKRANHECAQSAGMRHTCHRSHPAKLRFLGSGAIMLHVRPVEVLRAGELAAGRDLASLQPLT